MLDRIKLLNDTMAKRETQRVQFDHYRTKVNKMQKEGIQLSTDDKKQEKYARNMVKFEDAKFNYDSLTDECKDLLQRVEDKIERVIVDLTLKFSKEVQLNLYKDMNQAFFQLRNVESDMQDIAVKEQEMEKLK